MCLVLIAVGQHSKYPLIILSNRDEFYNRHSISADFWPDCPEIYGGRDRIHSGTWLGVHKTGYCGLVTNYRNPAARQTNQKSRGLLVSEFLKHAPNIQAQAYLESLKNSSNLYNGFNLIVKDESDLLHYSNVSQTITKLHAGIYSVSNHLLDTPWPKVLRAKQLFIDTQRYWKDHTSLTAIQKNLFDILSDKEIAPDSELPSTGVSIEIERALSPIFVDIPAHGYGTLHMSVILFDHKHHIFYTERSLLEEARAKQERQITITIE